MRRGKAFLVLGDLADCMRQAVLDHDLQPFCVGQILPGAEVPFDYDRDGCGEGSNGQWWVRMTTLAPTINFPEQLASPYPSKATLWAIALELGAMRHIDGLDEQGNPPSTEYLAELTRLQLEDMDAMRAAIICCFGSEPITIDPYEPIGPAGLVVGGTFSLLVAG